MARILCMTNGLPGMLHASFAVVARLQAAGHQVTYACPWDVGEAVRAQGIDYRQLPEANFDPAPPPLEVSGPLARWRRKAHEVTNWRQRRQRAVEALALGPFEQFLDELQPQLVLLDMELHDHILTVLGRGLPLALLSPWFSAWKRPGLPPLQRLLRPGHGLGGSRLGLEWAWWSQRVRRWCEIQRVRLRYLGTDRRAALREYARQQGVPRRTLNELDWTLFLYQGLPVFSMTAWEMEFPHSPPPWLHYVGPMVHAERVEQEQASGEGARIEEVCRQARAAGRKVLVATGTTMQEDDRSFSRRLVQAVAGRPDWTLILGLGGAADADTVGPVPDHVHVHPWVPLWHVLQYADAAIHHAGIHTIHECILREVPVLVCSGGRFDQDGCAARLEHHGLAHVGDRLQDDPVTLGGRIERLLEDEALRERLASMHQVFAAYGTERRLERAVEGLLEGHP